MGFLMQAFDEGSISTELDMLRLPDNPNAFFAERIINHYPLVGDNGLSDEQIQKIFEMAKKHLDNIVRERDAGEHGRVHSLGCHQLITVAVVLMARNWDCTDENKFSKYIALQFGYRDETGRIWGIITESINEALNNKNKFFIKRNKDRQFYETIMAHSFCPASSWYSLFDLIYKFYKENLECNYLPHDPLMVRLVEVLQNYFNSGKLNDDEYIIASTRVHIKVGIKRLVQERPVYSIKLFEQIINRMHHLISGSVSESDSYCMQLVDRWYFDRIKSSSSFKTSNNVPGIEEIGYDIAVSCRNISPKYRLYNDELYLSIPSIRLVDDVCQEAHAELFIDDHLYNTYELPITGNELGRTIRYKNIKISKELFTSNTINVRLILYENNDVVFDSKDGLSRDVLFFSDNNEISLQKLKKERYSLFVVSIARMSFENADLVDNASGIYDVSLHKDYEIKYDGRTIAFDYTDVKGLRVVKPNVVPGTAFEKDGKTYDLLNESSGIKVYTTDIEELKNYLVTINGETTELDDYFDDEAKNRAVIPVGCDSDKLQTVTVSSKNNRIVFSGMYYRIEKFGYRFNKNFYILPLEYNEVECICYINKAEYCYSAADMQTTICHNYNDGVIAITIPFVKYEFSNCGKCFFGRYYRKKEIGKNSKLQLTSSIEIPYTTMFNGTSYKSNNSFNLNDEKYYGDFLQNVLIDVMVDERTVTIGEIVINDQFVDSPIFTYENKIIYWNAPNCYIGDEVEFLLELHGTNGLIKTTVSMDSLQVMAVDEEFLEGVYNWIIKSVDGSTSFCHGNSFLGDERKARFYKKKIYIDSVTEDTDSSSEALTIKPVFIKRVRYVTTEFVHSEDGIFDIYTGEMYWENYEGNKIFYSRNYDKKRYKVNPVKIIYINDRFLRIVNEDDEGLYCYYNRDSKNPGYEMTDRNPLPGNMKFYKDILFYSYRTLEKGEAWDDAASGEIEEDLTDTETKAENTKAVSSIPIQSPVKGDKVLSLSQAKLVEQKAVIEADSNKRILVNAGPGTGKTWTIIEKIIYMTNCRQINAEDIQVLCFSRAAVNVVKTRLSEAINNGLVDESVNYVDIRTFDSFATQLLYWVKDSDDYSMLDKCDIERLSYDERIEKFVDVIKESPELISQCQHLIVDEVQDLVDVRANMVLNIIDYLPKETGITLFGDSCQSIYDYQVEGYGITSVDFYKAVINKNFNLYSFDKNYRQTTSLQDLTDEYRSTILTEESHKCNDLLKKLDDVLPEFDVQRVEDLEETSFERLSENSVGILTRSNAQALLISNYFYKKNIKHVLQKKLDSDCYNSWIAYLFNSCDLTQFNKETFIDALSKVNVNYTESGLAEELWNCLIQNSRYFSGLLSSKEMLRIITQYVKNSNYFVNEPTAKITVSTIHRSKGKEYDTVIVLDDLIAESSEELEEHRVNYVALTRAKKSIYRIAMKSDHSFTTEEGRCYSAAYYNGNKFLRYYEIDFQNDFDKRSFCKEKHVQEYFRKQKEKLKGKQIVLRFNSYDGQQAVYDVVLKETGMKVAETSMSFSNELLDVIRTIKHLPKYAEVYGELLPKSFSGLRIKEIVSEISLALGDELGVIQHQDMITWNSLLIEGYALAEK